MTDPFLQTPRLREPDETSHGVPDGDDGARIALVTQRWTRQDAALLARDKVIEENVRFLSGRQWDVYVPHLGQFVDATRYMSDSERRWRQRPTVNVLLYWFLLTHARLTEQAPVIAFQPATADRKDQQLAEIMDVIYKTLWQGDLLMDERFSVAAAWLLAGGECYAETCVTYDQNAAEYQLQGTPTLSMEGADGELIERELSEPVPYDQMGNPLAQLVPYEDDYGFEPMDGQAAMLREGTPKVTVLSPLEVRSEWGASILWEEKQWIIVRRYLSPEKVQELYGIDVKADTEGESSGAGVLNRMLLGSGNFGSVGNSWQTSDSPNGASSGLVTVDTMWEKPSPLSPETQDSAGGRMLVVTPTHVLHDSVRPYKTKAAGPIRQAQFVKVPGRAGFGTTPLEQLVPIQKTYNRGWAQILEHRNRCTNPILIYDTNSGFADQAQNVPGAMVGVDMAGLTRDPAYYLAPPQLSADVWRIQGMLFELLQQLGSIQGSQGDAPTEGASGELVSQLRFNSDRPLGTASRSLAMFLAGIADDLVAILPTCWPAERVITYAGEDSILKTLTVLPEMWDGRVNVRPDLQNALAETPEAKKARIFRDWQAGAFGDPMTEGAKKYLDLVQYPHTDRAAMNGGPDRATCERLLAEIAQGAPAMAVAQAFKPWYNYDVFLEVTRNHLASPEYLSYEPPVAMEFEMFYEALTQARAMALQMQAATIAAPAMTAQAAVQGQAQTALAANSPAPPSGDEPGSPVGPKGGPDATSPGPQQGREAA